MAKNSKQMEETLTTKSVDRLLKLPAVLAIIPVSRSAWYQGVATGAYPAGVKLGARSVAWRESSIIALVENGVEA